MMNRQRDSVGNGIWRLRVATMMAASVLGVGLCSSTLPRSIAAPASFQCSELPHNRWTSLSFLPNQTPTAVGVFDGAACALLAANASDELFTTHDYGRHWQKLAALGGTITGIVAESLAPGSAFVMVNPGVRPSVASGPSLSGLYVTRDFGAGLTPVDAFVGLRVLALAVTPQDPNVIFAAATDAAHLGSPTLLMKSTDAGNNWQVVPSQPGQPMVAASHLAVGQQASADLWAVDGTTAGGLGLWLSKDGGGSFSNVSGVIPNDIDVANTVQGDRMLAATPTGLIDSPNRGATTIVKDQGSNVVAIRHEPLFPNTLMAVIDGAPARSLDAGETFTRSNLAAAPSCSARLARDDGSPAVFVLTRTGCASAGSYLYQSDGGDLLLSQAKQAPAPPPAPPNGGNQDPIPMQLLTYLPIPTAVRDASWRSGSVAFDGSRLYWTGGRTANATESGQAYLPDPRIFMMSSAGAYLGSFVPHVVGHPKERILPWALSYDGPDGVLWVISGAAGSAGQVYRVVPSTGAAQRAFPTPVGIANSLTYDTSLRELRGNGETGGSGALNRRLWEFSGRGQIRAYCDINYRAAGNGSTLPVGSPVPLGTSPASSIAVGDGTMYVEDENDYTLFHVARNCAILQVYSHALFMENAENDQIACDMTTFGVPAIWMHENLGQGQGGVPAMVAFAVPAGYCPVATHLVLAPPRITTQVGLATPVCAVLVAGAFPRPLAATPVWFYLHDRFIGRATTSVGGKACVTYTPTESPGTRWPLKAAFFGTHAYLPSTANGRLDLLPRGLLQHVPGGPLLPPSNAQPVGPGPLVNPQVNPFTSTWGNPNTVPGPQPQAQPQTQAQSQAQGATQLSPQVAVVVQEQQQVQAAFARAAARTEAAGGDHPMSSSVQPWMLTDGEGMLAACGVMCGVALARRRRTVAAWQQRAPKSLG